MKDKLKPGFYFNNEDGCLWLIHTSGRGEFYSEVRNDWMDFIGDDEALRSWISHDTDYLGL